MGVGVGVGFGAGNTVSCREPTAAGSAFDFAETVTSRGAVTLGARNIPLLVICPADVLQVTAIFVVCVTTTTNCLCCPE